MTTACLSKLAQRRRGRAAARDDVPHAVRARIPAGGFSSSGQDASSWLSLSCKACGIPRHVTLALEGATTELVSSPSPIAAAAGSPAPLLPRHLLTLRAVDASPATAPWTDLDGRADPVNARSKKQSLNRAPRMSKPLAFRLDFHTPLDHGANLGESAKCARVRPMSASPSSVASVAVQGGFWTLGLSSGAAHVELHLLCARLRIAQRAPGTFCAAITSSLRACKAEVASAEGLPQLAALLRSVPASPSVGSAHLTPSSAGHRPSELDASEVAENATRPVAESASLTSVGASQPKRPWTWDLDFALDDGALVKIVGPGGHLHAELGKAHVRLARDKHISFGQQAGHDNEVNPAAAPPLNALDGHDHEADLPEQQSNLWMAWARRVLCRQAFPGCARLPAKATLRHLDIDSRAWPPQLLQLTQALSQMPVRCRFSRADDVRDTPTRVQCMQTSAGCLVCTSTLRAA